MHGPDTSEAVMKAAWPASRPGCRKPRGAAIMHAALPARYEASAPLSCNRQRSLYQVRSGIDTVGLSRDALARAMLHAPESAHRRTSSSQLVFASNGQSLPPLRGLIFPCHLPGGRFVHADGQARVCLAHDRQPPSPSAAPPPTSSRRLPDRGAARSALFSAGRTDETIRTARRLREIYPGRQIVGRPSRLFQPRLGNGICDKST